VAISDRRRCARGQVPERLAVFYRSGLAQRTALAAIGATVGYGAFKNPRMSTAAGLGEFSISSSSWFS